MIAAIYARKSTEQNVSDDVKSVTRQVELARAFAESKGWQVAESHVYQDDGISGAEFLKRDGLNALLAAVRSHPCPFTALITMEPSRLGREQTETAVIVREILRAGVRIFTYSDGREITLDSALDKFTFSALTFVSEMERELARARTREAMRAKAKAGHVAGGKVYGYMNVREGSNSVRRVNEAEAEIVRRIFKLTADGYGLLRIAKTLNAEGVPSPRGDGWATTAIREMLRRDLYRGRIVYGKTQWADKDGTKKKVAVSAEKWLQREAPELRIVPEDLWRAAHTRLDRTRQSHSGQRRPNGQLNGRPESGLVAHHLLSGFLRCGVCGGNMFVISRSGKRGSAQLYYVCTTYHKRGTTRCTNRWGVPYHHFTDTVLKRLKKDLLNPTVIEGVVTAQLQAQAKAPDEQKAQRDALHARLAAVDREIARYTRAIGLSDDEVQPLVEALQARQRERTDLSANLEHLDGLERAAETFDVEAFRRTVTEILRHFDITAYHPGVPQQARKILRILLPSPIKVTPLVDKENGVVWFEYVVQCAFDGPLVGVLGTGPTQDATEACPGLSQKVHTTELVPPG